MALSNTDLRNGVVFKDGGNTYQVLKFELKKRGRGSSNVKVKARDLNSGAIIEKTYGGNESVEEVDLTRSNAQYLYADASAGYFMDAYTFEQFELPMNSVKDMIDYIKEGQKVIVLKLDGKAAAIEIPKSVDLKVEYTEPAVKGDTSGGALKNAKLETGVTVKVPLFINTGDVIKVNTDLGTYTSKA
jgi:elongation factor P